MPKQICGRDHWPIDPCPKGWTWDEHQAEVARRLGRKSGGLGPIAIADQAPLAVQIDATVRKPKTRVLPADDVAEFVAWKAKREIRREKERLRVAAWRAKKGK